MYRPGRIFACLAPDPVEVPCFEDQAADVLALLPAGESTIAFEVLDANVLHIKAPIKPSFADFFVPGTV